MNDKRKLSGGTEMKKLALLLSAILLIGILAACGSESAKEGENTQLSDKKLVIGATAGLHEEILEEVKKVAEKDGLEIEIKVFSDYVLPNTALVEKDLDVNSFQHQPFLDSFNKDKGHNLVAVGNTVLAPIGIYSEKLKSIDELKEGATFGIPNDPTNQGRTLDVLEANGLIKIKEEKKGEASIHDLEENKLNLKFVELDAAQIPSQLVEVDVAAINTNFAVEAGLNPAKDAILRESTDSPYVNLLVVRDENKNDPVIEKLVKAYHSDEVKKFIEDNYAGSLIPGW